MSCTAGLQRSYSGSIRLSPSDAVHILACAMMLILVYNYLIAHLSEYASTILKCMTAFHIVQIAEINYNW